MASSHGASVRPVTANLTPATDDTAAAVRVMTVDASGAYAAAGGGTQYTEADTDASITGTAIMWEDTSDTLRAVSAAKPLPVSDAGGTLSIDDGGGAITVDGTVGVSGTVTVDSELTTADLDTGGGTDTRAVVGLVGSKSGGAQLIPGDATAGLKVDLGADNDVTITSGTITTITNVVHVDDNSGSLTVDGTVTANLAAGTNNIGDVDVLSVPAPLSTTGGGTEATALRVTLASDSTGVVSVDDNGSSLTVDGSVSASQSGTWTVQPGNTANTTAWKVDASSVAVPITDNSGSVTVDDGGTSLTVDGTVSANVTPATSGGLTISRTLSAASTNGTSVKASAGQVFGWYISSQATYDTFVKLYNKASAPTVGTDTPVMTLKLPPGGVANVEFTNGIAFGTGIAFAITKAIGDSDTTAVAANDVALNLFYK